MTYSVRNRLTYIGTRQNEVRGEPITYYRGAASNSDVRACPGHTDVQDLIPENVVTVARYVDIIIFASSLTLPGLGRVLPQRGDKFVWEGKTYVVTSPTATDECYNFTTMYRDRLRVHGLLTTESQTP